MKELARIAKAHGTKCFQQYKTSYYYHFLLVSLLLMTTVSSFVVNNNVLIPLFDLAYLSVLVISAAAAFRSRGRTIWLLIVCFLATIAFRALELVAWHNFFDKTYHFLVMVMLVMTFVIIIYSIMNSRKIDSNIISGAICGYFIIGIIFAFFYILMETMYPNSFKFETLMPSHLTHNELADEFYYFSMITLTSVGYGDIIPVSRLMKHVTIIEAVAGQIYITIIIARLVGIQVSQKHHKIEEENS